jgi:hypothetical protein
MGNFPHFIWAVAWEWLVQMSGPLSVVAALWKQWKESKAITHGVRHKEAIVFWVLAAVCVIIAFFSVWQKEFLVRQVAESNLETAHKEVYLNQRRIDRIHDGSITNRNGTNTWPTQITVTQGSNSFTANQSASVSGTGTTVTMVGRDQIINHSISSNELRRAMEDAVQTFQNKKGLALTRLFPGGHALFGITETGVTQPILSPNPRFVIHWERTNYFITMSREQVFMRTPDITILPSYELLGNDVAIARQVGARFDINMDTSDTNSSGRIVDNFFNGGTGNSTQFGQHPDSTLTVGIVDTESQGAVVVFGLQPYPPK